MPSAKPKLPASVRRVGKPAKPPNKRGAKQVKFGGKGGRPRWKNPPPPVLTGEPFHRQQAYAIRKLYSQHQTLWEPAKHILRCCVANPPTKPLKITLKDCEVAIWRYAQFLIRKRYFVAAAILLWGPEQFTPEPKCTQQVWEALNGWNKNLVQGGGSLSKSYSGGVWFALDWLDDPAWTCLKVMSVTGEHAKRNIFANIKNLLSNTLVPVPGIIIKSESIQINDDDKQGIHLVTIPAGDDGKGRLRGFHPVPRTGEESASYGRLSRVGVLLDEAEEIPGGVWEDINNILLTETVDASHVKIFAATNPKDRLSKFGEYAEPADGWSSLDIDSSEAWESARGWHVTRLDGAQCENVVERRVIFPGLQTAEGFDNLLKLGENNSEYYTMGRGWFPETSAQAVIITPTLFDRAKGRYHFVGPVTAAGSVDLAFEGGDSVIYTLLRTGMADGWWDARDTFHKLKTERRVIQVEQQFLLPKLPTLEQAQAIMRMSRDLHVNPKWLGGDRTGNGTGVMDSLSSLYGADVYGVNFSWGSTDTLILDDDTVKCSDLYHDIITEMAFAVRRFMETDLLKINTGIVWNDLERCTVTRRYNQVGRGFVRIEDKKAFKKRNAGASPDRFDSMIIGVHVVRINTGLSAPQVEPGVGKPRKKELVQHGTVDLLEFLDMT